MAKIFGLVALLGLFPLQLMLPSSPNGLAIMNGTISAHLFPSFLNQWWVASRMIPTCPLWWAMPLLEELNQPSSAHRTGLITPPPTRLRRRLLLSTSLATRNPTQPMTEMMLRYGKSFLSSEIKYRKFEFDFFREMQTSWRKILKRQRGLLRTECIAACSSTNWPRIDSRLGDRTISPARVSVSDCCWSCGSHGQLRVGEQSAWARQSEIFDWFTQKGAELHWSIRKRLCRCWILSFEASICKDIQRSCQNGGGPGFGRYHGTNKPLAFEWPISLPLLLDPRGLWPISIATGQWKASLCWKNWPKRPKNFEAKTTTWVCHLSPANSLFSSLLSSFISIGYLRPHLDCLGTSTRRSWIDKVARLTSLL